MRGKDTCDLNVCDEKKLPEPIIFLRQDPPLSKCICQMKGRRVITSGVFREILVFLRGMEMTHSEYLVDPHI